MHGGSDEENLLASGFLTAAIDFLGAQSVLEVGAGTGRALRRLKQTTPGLRLLGVEPSESLRHQGYESGLSTQEFVVGYAQEMQFENGAFDIVFELAALHHMPRPDKAISEMLRVARRGIFLSDSNDFGQGGFVARRFKQSINALGLRRLFDALRSTRSRLPLVGRRLAVLLIFCIQRSPADPPTLRLGACDEHDRRIRQSLSRRAVVALLGIKRA